MSEKRKRPGGRSQASPKSSADILNSSPDRWHSTATAQERREAVLLAELRSLGYTVAVSCTECGHALTNPASIARGHIGPKCAAKVVTR